MKDDLLWVEKYRPKKIADVAGNDEAKAAFIEWFKNKRHTKKAVLLFGPPGVGKTTLVNAAANEFGFRVIEMNASDTRTEKTISKVAGKATSYVGLDTFSSESKGNILFLDEVDGIAGNEDRGGVPAIIKIIEDSRVPVIMAANDPDIDKLRPLKKVSGLVRFQQVRVPLIILTLQRICQSEGVKAEFEALEKIALNSRGDVRSAINDLQSLSESDKKLTVKDTEMLSYRNQDINMYDTLREYFSAKTFNDASMLLSRSNVDFDDLLLSIGDNLPKRYNDAVDLAASYDLVSQADVFRGRIGVENWHLLKYYFNCLARAAAVSPETYRQFDLIMPPIRIISLFWTKGKRTTLEGICGKIGAQCHVSRRTAKKDIVPFIKSILQRKKVNPIIDYFEFTPEEVDFIVSMNRF